MKRVPPGRWLWIFLMVVGPAFGTHYHVSPGGSDLHDGTSEADAFRTIGHGVGRLEPGDVLILHGGIYRERLTFHVSGTAAEPITVRAAVSGAQPEAVVLSGFDRVMPGESGTGIWQLHSGAIWKIQLPLSWGLETGRNLVAVDGEGMRYARWPDAGEPIGFDRRGMAEADGGGVDSDSPGSLDPALAGRVPGYAWTDFYDGHYLDSALEAFADGSWVGAHLDLCAGHNWWAKTAVVTGNSGNRIDFQYRFADDWNPILDTPKGGDRYAIRGHLQALDSPGEFFLDVHGLNGPENMLYVWLPDGGSPDNRDIGVLNRETTIDFGSNSHIHVMQVQIFGGAIVSQFGSESNVLDGVEVDYGSLNRSSLDYGAGRAVWLRGDNHVFRNGRVGNSFRRTIEVNGTGSTVENSVLHDAYEHLLTLSGAASGTFRRNTGYRAGNTAVDIGTDGSLIELNHFYHAGMRITDVAVLNTWNGGDLGGTEIRHNWVHSNLAPRDGSRSWWGGQGIRLDSGSSQLGCSNVLIHHNVVWGTTAESSITVWGLEPGMVNYGDARAHVYQNTVDANLVLAGSGSVAGQDWRRNIAIGFNNVTGGLDGAIVAGNLFEETSLTGNYTGNPCYVSPANRNYRLRPDSPAHDTGTPIAGITGEGPHAYLGALDPDSDPWRPGALLRERDLPGLQAQVVADNFGTRRIRLAGLPPGRTFPDGFVLRIGTRESTAFTAPYSFSGHTVEGFFSIDLAGLSGSLPVSCSLDGVNFISLSAPVDISPEGILSVNSDAADAAGGSEHLLQLQGITGRVARHVPVVFKGPGSELLSTAAIPWITDTSAWIADGMQPDGADLRFVSWDGNSVLRHHVESGLGQNNTLIWLRDEGTTGDVASFEDRSLVHVSYGDAQATASDDPGVLTDGFPPLASQSILLHLQANALQETHAPGGTVSAWPDRFNSVHDAVQADSLKRPAFSAGTMGSLPAVRFDGLNDVLDVNGATGLGNGPGRFYVVYRNPDPGATLWQRLFSGRSHTGMLDYVDGVYAIVHNDSGTAVAQGNPVLEEKNFPGGQSRENFRIGGRSLSENTELFRGEIGELIAFEGDLSTEERTAVRSYLKSKYGISGRPEAEFPAGSEIPGIAVLVNGVPAGGVSWAGEGSLRFVAPPYTGGAELPVAVDLTVVAPDGTPHTLPGGFRYRSLFESWQVLHFGEAALQDPGLEGDLWGAGADPDGDGLNNLEEYAFAGDPHLASQSLRPWLSLAGERLSIHFHRAREELTYTVQFSEDLAGWGTLVINPGNPGEWVGAADTIDLSASPERRRFLRLSVSE